MMKDPEEDREYDISSSVSDGLNTSGYIMEAGAKAGSTSLFCLSFFSCPAATSNSINPDIRRRTTQSAIILSALILIFVIVTSL